MQVVGRECAVCGRVVVAAGEGTWCAVCQTVLHAACVAARDDVCPTCRAPRAAPEPHFVQTRLCTKCLRLYQDPRGVCAACGTSMQFDDAATFARRAREIHARGRNALVLGIAMIALGVVPYAFLLIDPFLAIPCVPRGAVASYLLVIGGIASAGFGLRLRRFG